MGGVRRVSSPGGCACRGVVRGRRFHRRPWTGPVLAAFGRRVGGSVASTRLGLITLVADGDAVTGLYFRRPGQQTFGPVVGPAEDPLLAEAAEQLHDYLDRRRTGFDLPLHTHGDAHGFRQTVQRHLPAIGYGQTRSYRQVAELVGNPRAVRAVGTACATNPLPAVLPCHRVLRTDGTLGGYIGGLEAKTALLNLEAAA